VETQIQFTRQTPASESDWEYSSVRAWSIGDYIRNGVILPLTEVLQTNVEFQSPLGISWPANLYCTKNFFFALSTGGECKLNNYLRPVDALLCVGQDIILISERELNSLLPHFWNGMTLGTEGNPVRLVNLPFLSSRQASDSIPLLLSFGPTPDVDDLSILALQVFNGEAMYWNRQALLPTLLAEKDCGKKNAIELISMRGNIHMFDKSDLDFFDVD
jgi:hypothetical protein